MLRHWWEKVDPYDYTRPRIYIKRDLVDFYEFVEEFLESKRKLWVAIPGNKLTQDLGFGVEMGVVLSREHDILPIIITRKRPSEFYEEYKERLDELNEILEPYTIDSFERVIIYFTPKTWLEEVDKLRDILNEINCKMLLISDKSVRGYKGLERVSQKLEKVLGRKSFEAMLIKNPLLSIGELDEIGSLMIIGLVITLAVLETMAILRIIEELHLSYAAGLYIVILIISLILHVLTGIGKAVDLIHGVRLLYKLAKR